MLIESRSSPYPDRTTLYDGRIMSARIGGVVACAGTRHSSRSWLLRQQFDVSRRADLLVLTQHLVTEHGREFSAPLPERGGERARTSALDQRGCAGEGSLGC